MLTLFAREKKAVSPEEILEIEKTATAPDEIERLLHERIPKDLPELPNERLYIFQRQF